MKIIFITGRGKNIDKTDDEDDAGNVNPEVEEEVSNIFGNIITQEDWDLHVCTVFKIIINFYNTKVVFIYCS